MTPTEFKSRYIASLPDVPGELREELDLESFMTFDPEASARFVEQDTITAETKIT
mgnify:CR=1 FL=1|tara:strand:+ start:768 stop:932 length:165 start_codon:yes stop_codon:yes gene_type:complete